VVEVAVVFARDG